MTSVADVYSSKYLSASELGNKRVTVTIERVELESVGQGDQARTKPAIFFEGKEKALLANKTNCLTIAGILGSQEFEDWPGHRITLYSTMVTFQGKVVPAIRVMPAPQVPTRTAVTGADVIKRPNPAPEKVAAAHAAAQEFEDDSDSVPF